MNEFLKFAKPILVGFLGALFGYFAGHVAVAMFGKNIWVFLVGTPVAFAGGCLIGWLVNKMFDRFGGGFGLG
jgi:hypothetical protein